MFCAFRNIFANRPLIYQLTRREIVTRYRGSLLGMVWSLIQPLLMLAIYSFVFGYVMKSRWPVPGGDQPGMFPIILFSGLVLHGLLAECLARAPHLIVSQPNFVKKVVFPLEVLPAVMVASSLFHFLIGMVVLLGAAFWVLGAIPVTALLIPLVVAPLLLVCLGLGWGLAALGVYVRDIGQIIGLVITMLLFFGPILYPLSVLPEWLQPIILLNPLTFPVEAMRALLIAGEIPSITLWGGYTAVSVLVAFVGLCFFEKTRRGFADVL